MLRVTILDDAQGKRFKLEGKLAREWVLEATTAWTGLRDASVPIESSDTTRADNRLPGGKMVVDLFGVSFVDDNGRALLSQMHSAGATLVGCGPMINALIEEVRARNESADIFSPLKDQLPGRVAGLILLLWLINFLCG